MSSQVSHRANGAKPPNLDFLAGGGETGARIRALDWSRTPLGPPEQWPQSLKTIVRVMLDSRYAMWMLWGPELTFFCNDAYLPTVGVKRDWVLGARSDKVWQEIWPDIGPRIAHVLEQGQATWDEALLLFLQRKGFTEETYHTFSYSPIYDDESRIAGMLCVVTEVTERVIGERRLRVLKDLATRAVGATAVQESCRGACDVLDRYPFDIPFASIYLLDHPSRLARCCASTHGLAERVLLEESPSTWSLDELLDAGTAQDIPDLPACGIQVSSGPWRDLVQQAFMLPFRSSSAEHIDGFLLIGVSPRRPFDESYRSFLDLIVGQVAAAIADAQAAESQRKRAEALAEIDRAKTVFFSNISHEFRTPLTLMLGPIEQLLGRANIPPTNREQLELTHRNALRLQRLVNSLLDFSRLEAGRVQASYEPTDLPALTRDLASSFRSAIEGAGLQFLVTSDGPDTPVYVDREMWEKIVLNLLSNAFKFTLQGSIALRLRCEGNEVVLEVADTGVGIPQQELPRLFERFHRIEGTQGRTQEGSGIGLALVQELVKMHGGTIEASSVQGTGTQFTVRVPLGTAHLPANRLRAPRPQSSTAISAHSFVQEARRWLPADVGNADMTGSGPILVESAAPERRFEATYGARVLLADDNADMRSYVTALLAPYYEVESVADGEAALVAIRRQRPALVLSDVMMPKLDGFALLSALRSDAQLRTLPVILLSARAGEESQIEGLGAGADDYLVKPFSARELFARVGALLESTQLRMRAAELIEQLVDGLFVADRHGRYIEVNPVGCQMFAMTREEFLSCSLEDMLAAEDLPRLPEQIALFADGEVHRSEWKFRRRDGSIFIGELVGRRLRDGGYQGLIRDITERRQAEMSLREEARARELLGQVSHALVAAQLDIERVVQTATDAATELSGAAFGAFFYNVKNDQGESYTLHTLSGAPRDAFEHFPQPRNTAVFGPTFRGEGVVRSADITADPRYGHNPPHHGMPEGHLAVRSYLAVPVKSAAGEVLGGLFFGHPEPAVFDERAERLVLGLAAQAAVAFENARLHQAAQQEIAERKRIEEELSEADRRKDEFLAMLAHELRNPLAPIRNAVELLARILSVEDPRARAAIEMTKRQARQLTRLVDDLLDVSRITRGSIKLERRPLDLSDVMRQAIETVEPLFQEKRHRISITRSSYRSVYVSADQARLLQCLANVLTNAAKYTDAGGKIQVQTRTEGSSAVIEIIDSGAGIAPELLPRIFDLFVQGDRTLDRSQGGLGVGLAVVKRLVQMHDGQVSARSAGLGQGSTFEIRLPLIRRPQPSATEVEEITGTPKRVLIVDDNQDAADSLVYLLQLEKHQVEAVYSAQDALARAPMLKPDVILLDIGLPHMDGYQVAQQLRGMPAMSAVRLIALTGYGQADDRQRTRVAGFDGHLVKPVDLMELKRALAGLAQDDA